jgi:hypothetical protein
LTQPGGDNSEIMLLGQPLTSRLLRDALECLGPNGEMWNQHRPNGGPLSCILETICMICEHSYESLGVGYSRSVGYSRFELIRDTILKETLGVSRGYEISTWNNAPERTFADVKKLLEEMIRKAEQAGD